MWPFIAGRLTPGVTLVNAALLSVLVSAVASDTVDPNREGKAQRLLDVVKWSHSARAATLNDALARTIRLQAIAEEYPGTAAGREALLSVARTKALWGARIAEEEPETAARLLEETVTACEQLQSNTRGLTRREPRDVAYHAAFLRGKALSLLGRSEDAVAAFEEALRNPSTRAARARDCLAEMHRLYEAMGDAERDVDCLERFLQLRPAVQALDDASWAQEAMPLLMAYRTLDPMASELIAALADRAPASVATSTQDQRLRESIRQQARKAEDQFGQAPPEHRALGYFRLWRRGYYPEMWELLSAGLREGLTGEEFVVRAEAFEREHGRPVHVGEFRVQSADRRRAEIVVDVDFGPNAPAGLVSGAQRVELELTLFDDGRLVWQVSRAPAPHVADGATRDDAAHDPEAGAP